MTQSRNISITSYFLFISPKLFLNSRIERIMNKCRFTRPAYTGNADKLVQGKINIQALEIVLTGTLEPDHFTTSFSSFYRNFNFLLFTQIFACQGFRF